MEMGCTWDKLIITMILLCHYGMWGILAQGRNIKCDYLNELVWMLSECTVFQRTVIGKHILQTTSEVSSEMWVWQIKHLSQEHLFSHSSSYHISSELKTWNIVYKMYEPLQLSFHRVLKKNSMNILLNITCVHGRRRKMAIFIIFRWTPLRSFPEYLIFQTQLTNAEIAPTLTTKPCAVNKYYSLWKQKYRTLSRHLHPFSN